MVDLPPPDPFKPPTAGAPVEPEQQQEAPPADNAAEATAAAEEAEEADPAEGGTPAGDGKRAKRKAFRALEIAEQVHQVQEWLTLGKRPNQIRQLCSEHWGLQTRVAEMRIQDARRQMVVDANVMDRTDKVGQMLQQLEQVLEQSLQSKQGSNAIGALRLQADLLQLLTRQN